MAMADLDTRVVTVEEVLDGHVTLEIESLDRIYLNLYVPTLQVSGQAATFLGRHSGNPIPSPAIMEQRGNRFRIAVRCFAETNDIPVVHFAKDERKIDTVRPLMEQAESAGRSRVVAVGVAQEYQRVFSATKGETGQGAVWFDFYKADRRVTCYYFYVWDQDFGPGFIKLCAYFPYPGKVWVNGHEWAKRQAARAGIEFAALSNGFADCADPAGLQEICDQLGPGQIHVFIERWLARLPLPLDGRDREAGYWWQASMRQIETSRTLVFDAPHRARAFFEALIADNLDLGRPSNVEILFKGNLAGSKSTRRPTATAPRSTAKPTAWSSMSSGNTHGSSSTSKTAAPCASRPSSTTHATWRYHAASNTSTNCRPRPDGQTSACYEPNAPARTPSWEAQPLRGSQPRRWKTADNGPRPCDSATRGSWPWPAPWQPSSTRSPAPSPTRAFAPW
jgi:hypothetical protein